MNDVASILASYDARIAAARKVREGLSGKRDWKQPITKRYFVDREPREATRLSPTERKVLEVLIVAPHTTAMAAQACGVRGATAGHAMSTVKKIMTAQGIRFTDMRTTGGMLTIHDIEAARRLL